MVDIPEDLRHLRDFPTYDTTFQDGPKFRQNLQYWTFKTEKVGVALVIIDLNCPRIKRLIMAKIMDNRLC